MAAWQYLATLWQPEHGVTWRNSTDHVDAVVLSVTDKDERLPARASLCLTVGDNNMLDPSGKRCVCR
jgi:hypothetical protein